MKKSRTPVSTRAQMGNFRFFLRFLPSSPLLDTVKSFLLPGPSPMEPGPIGDQLGLNVPGAGGAATIPGAEKDEPGLTWLNEFRAGAKGDGPEPMPGHIGEPGRCVGANICGPAGPARMLSGPFAEPAGEKRPEK